jgi:hypothetical protein
VAANPMYCVTLSAGARTPTYTPLGRTHTHLHPPRTIRCYVCICIHPIAIMQ